MNEQPASPPIPIVARPLSLGLTLVHTLPVYLEGLFTRSRFWVTVNAALRVHGLTVPWVSWLRKRYRSPYLYLRVLRNKTLLVLDQEGIQRILDHSPAIYADPEPKRRGMSRFQPGAVTISRGDTWVDRRRFNSGVLATGDAVHPLAGQFLQIVRDECESMCQVAPRHQSWKHFARLFERLTLQIIFGRTAVDDVYLTRTLTRLMRNANRARFLPPRRRLLAEYQHAIAGYLRWPQPGSLAALCHQFPATEGTRIESQLTHWIFAMHETLATNTVRALALIAAHPDVYQRLQPELNSADLSQPATLDAQSYLGGCLQEAMRLWPTTPLLVRETTTADRLGGETIPARSQVLILNSFNHRDRQLHDAADKFAPERWQHTPVSYRFNHLSNGTQHCAGKDLALFLGKAVLASLLQQRRYTLLKPHLDSSRRLPHAMNYFRTRFACQPVA